MKHKKGVKNFSKKQDHKDRKKDNSKQAKR